MRWIVILLIVVQTTGCASIMRALFRDHEEIVTGPTQRGEYIEFTIEWPNVRSPKSDYPLIEFGSRDVVTIFADGCVQTGGFGQTWKRYVDPQGPGTDYLYHAGIVLPPGVYGSVIQPAGVEDNPSRRQYLPGVPVRLAVIQGVELHMPDADKLGHLTLTYEDEDGAYDDNGYWKPDLGWGYQCREKGPAKVRVLIRRGASLSLPLPGPKPFDLVGNAYDANGFRKNPSWGYQHTNLTRNDKDEVQSAYPEVMALCTGVPDRANCTSTSTTAYNIKPDSECNVLADWPGTIPKFWNRAAVNKIPGHVNYEPVTYEGKLMWDGVALDGDYNFWLVPETNGVLIPGLTAWNPNGIGIEFDANESIARADLGIDQGSGIWYRLQQLARFGFLGQGLAPPDIRLSDELGPAVVVGLLNLDCTHGCHTELHPVYALALLERSEGEDDIWAIMARNFGTGGDCSQKSDKLPLWRYRKAGESSLVVHVRNPRASYLSDPKPIWTVDGKFGNVKVGQESPRVEKADASEPFGLTLSFDFAEEDPALIVGHIRVRRSPEEFLRPKALVAPGRALPTLPVGCSHSQATELRKVGACPGQ